MQFLFSCSLHLHVTHVTSFAPKNGGSTWFGHPLCVLTAHFLLGLCVFCCIFCRSFLDTNLRFQLFQRLAKKDYQMIWKNGDLVMIFIPQSRRCSPKFSQIHQSIGWYLCSLQELNAVTSNPSYNDNPNGKQPQSATLGANHPRVAANLGMVWSTDINSISYVTY